MVRRRRQTYARRRYRRDLKRYLVKNRRPLCGLTVGYAIVMAVLSVVLDGYLLGIFHGAATVLFLAMVFVAQITATGSIRHLTGAWGEDNTKDLLRWARHRRLIHGWVDSLEIQGGDVDHLVATPSGWIAIDSKWHSQSLDWSVVARDVSRSTKAARRASLILRSLHQPADVRPAVVLWGGSRDELSDLDRVVDGVEIVSGSDLKDWFRKLPTGGMDRRAAKTALHDLRTFKARVRVPDAPARAYQPIKR